MKKINQAVSFFSQKYIFGNLAYKNIDDYSCWRGPGVYAFEKSKIYVHPKTHANQQRGCLM